MIPVITLRYHPALGGVETRVLEVTTRLAPSFPLRVITSDLRMERPFQRLSEEENIAEYNLQCLKNAYGDDIKVAPDEVQCEACDLAPAEEEPQS